MVALDTGACRAHSDKTVSEPGARTEVWLAAFWRQDRAIGPVPDRRSDGRLVSTERRAQSLWGPQVAVDSQRGRFLSVAQEHRVDVLAADSKDVADLDRWQHAAPDPIADRLGRQFELVGHFLDAEGFLGDHSKISKDISVSDGL